MQENDQQTDFVEYLELVVEYYKQVERLDAAGRTLGAVFKTGEERDRKWEGFRKWIINLDVWGSFYPLNVQCYDI